MGALRAERCHEVYREKASGKAVKGRPQLEKAIDALGRGDVLVVAEWDRATRSMMAGVHIIERIHVRGAMIKVLDKPHLDLTQPIGRGFIVFLSALSGGRTPKDREACQRWSGRGPQAGCAHGSQA
jgi:DNA invertase Pin-like site-specific DNA recombinase